LLCHFFVRRKKDVFLPVTLYMLLVFGCSLTSDMLFNVFMLVFPMMFYDYTLDEKPRDVELVKA